MSMGFILPDDEALKIRGTMLGYLNAVVYGEHRLAHKIIDEEACNLVHSLTVFILSWIAAHAVLPPDQTVVDWLKDTSFKNAEIEIMTVEEREAFMRHLAEGLGGEPGSES